MPRLIINADDFGLTVGVNRAIAESHSTGVVSSTTLMASGSAFDDAVRRSEELQDLSVGCHVVLADGIPVLPVSQVSSLVESPTQRFPESISSVMTRAFRGQMRADEIQAEVTAQIQKLLAAGVAVSHIDSHKHAHLFPQILRPILRAAQDCGIQAIRNPFGRLSIRLAAGHPGLWKRYFQVSLLNRLAQRFRREVEKAGMLSPDGSLGVVATGSLDLDLFRAMVEGLPEGTWEFVCHPGYNDADLQKVATRLRDSREHELSVLTAESTKNVIKNAGIELISYRQFAAQPRK